MGKSLLKQYYEALVIDRPLTTLLLVMLILAGFGYFIPRFELDVSADSLILENDTDLNYYRSIRARYGSDDFLIVTYSPYKDLFEPDVLNDLKQLRDSLEKINEVESVVSIFDVPLLESPPVTLTELNEEIRTLEHPKTDKTLARKELQESLLYNNRVMSSNGRTTAMQVNFKRDPQYLELRRQRDELSEKRLEGELSLQEEQQLKTITDEYNRYTAALTEQQETNIQQVRDVLARHQDKAEIHLGGIPMIVVDMKQFIRHDLAVFGLAVLGILALLLGLVFKSFRWVVLPLLTAAATTAVTVGFLGLMGWKVTVVSSNFIALLLIFSISISIHLIVRHRELHVQNPLAEQRELVTETVRSKVVPCLYTVITTLVAFVSLVISGIRPVIDFGWFMVVGLIATFVLAFTLFPATLMLMKAGTAHPLLHVSGFFTRHLAQWVECYGNKIFIIAIISVVLSVYGISSLTVENRFIDYFKKTTEIYQGMLLIDQQLGGTTPLDIIIDAPKEEELTDNLGLNEEIGDDEEDEFDAELEELFKHSDAGFAADSYWYNTYMLKEIGDIHNTLEEVSATGKILSLHTTFETLKVVSDDDAIDDFFLSLVYKKLTPEVKQQLISPYLSDDGDQLRLDIRVYDSDKNLNRDALLKKINDLLVNKLNLKQEQVHLSGMLVLYNNMLQSLFRSQILTLGFVFLSIMVTFALLFRSLKVAVLAIIPNLLAVALMLGLMGGFGIPLDIMTITIAAISIGIAVDNSIHYVHRFRDEWYKDNNYIDSVYRAHGSIGQALFYTTITITIGFSILALSNFVPTIYFGLLTAFAMVTALLANLAVLPLMLQRFKPY